MVTVLDAQQSVFFERELEYIKSKSYDVVKAPLKAFELIPVSQEVPSGAETIKYVQYDSTGIAKIIANYADDLPRCDVKGKEFSGIIQSVGNSYGYSLQEIRASQLSGKSLDQRKATACVRAMREAWNKLAFFGDVASNLPGWLSNANIPAALAPLNGAGTSRQWANKSATEILADLNNCANDIVDVTNGAEQPNTIVLPIKQYTQISSTPAGTGTDTTILEYFLRNNPFVTAVEWANELANVAAHGGNDIMIAYDRSADKFSLEMPQMFEQLTAQERGLEFVVPCHSRIAGVLVYYPLSQNILFGI